MSGEAIGMGIGAIANVATTELNNNYNRNRQKEQFRQQKELNKQGAELALQQWKDTNYSAQRRELEKAGLSTGLLYGQSGGGGVTANTGSGGSAPNYTPSQMNLGIDPAMIANIELAKAQANKANAEADNLRGVQKDKTVAETDLLKTQNEGNELANKLANKTLDERAEIVKHELLKTAGQGQQEQAKGKLADARENVALQQDKANVAYALTKTRLEEKKINLTESQIAKIANDIATNTFNAETARNTLGVDKVTGTLLQNIVNEIYNMIGYDKDKADQKVNDGKK